MKKRAKIGGGEGCSGMTYKIGQARSRAKVRTSKGSTEEETRSRMTKHFMRSLKHTNVSQNFFYNTELTIKKI